MESFIDVKMNEEKQALLDYFKVSTTINIDCVIAMSKAIIVRNKEVDGDWRQD